MLNILLVVTVRGELILLTMYIVSLMGKGVFHDCTHVCIMENFSDLNEYVRPYIKSHYNLEFEELSANFTSGYWKFRLADYSDTRDIALIVESCGKAVDLIQTPYFAR